ncbi:Late competence development protein ComFB [Natronincola peptidivorans]|uniref:Late competence development protein ComFB n=1 Tax=Natronincola peptidivorans TaxID=426128 RepID=A0A1I0GHK6_9FIRM|nr:late competence development ComFB family protein [Natronincola peptidivorans]SET70363.1 Late competence development protein ComFB [Natronincola peptidivorans]
MLKNYTEELIREVLWEYKNTSEICQCKNCEEDIIKTVLNDMKPKYFISTSSEGERKSYILNKQLRLEALIKITSAVEEVTQLCKSQYED